jgi:hypothetical protein
VWVPALGALWPPRNASATWGVGPTNAHTSGARTLPTTKRRGSVELACAAACRLAQDSRFSCSTASARSRSAIWEGVAPSGSTVLPDAAPAKAKPKQNQSKTKASKDGVDVAFATQALRGRGRVRAV